MDDMTNQAPMDEMARLSLAAREALTDGMVERLTTMGGNGLELLDRLNDPDTSAAVHDNSPMELPLDPFEGVVR